MDVRRRSDHRRRARRPARRRGGTGPGASGLSDSPAGDRRHPRRAGGAAGGRQSDRRHGRAAGTAGHAAAQRAGAADAASGRLPHQPPHERPAHHRRGAAHHAQADRRRRRTCVRRPRRDLAGPRRVLARRVPAAVHPDPLQRHRSVGDGGRQRAGPAAERYVDQRHVGRPVRLARPERHRGVPLQGVGTGCAAHRARRPGGAQHPAAQRRRRAHPHLPGPAAERARRSAVRVLLHDADRHDRSGHGTTHRHRPPRPLPAGQRIAERPLFPDGRGRAAVLLARHGGQLSQGRHHPQRQR